MSFDPDELINPTWMDQKFFQNVLQKSEADGKLQVTAIDISPAANFGDHYASTMFRVKVTYTSKGMEKLKSVIVKTKPEIEGPKKDLLDNSPIFDIEMKMYIKTVPEMERLLMHAGDKTNFGPKLLYSSKQPTDVLVFEDLCERGYLGLPTSCLPFDGLKIVFERLAKWHACSFYMSKQDLIDFSDYNMNLYNGTLGPGSCDLIMQNMIPMKKALMTCPELVKYESNLDCFMKNMTKLGTDNFAPHKEKDGYNVLNHGDMHGKNLMMKMEDGKIVDILFLDYQVTNYGSPALDICYAMYNIFDEETRSTKRNELIKLYYQEFVNTLKNLGFCGKIPTMVDLQIELLIRGGFVEIYTALAILPFRSLDFSQLTPEDLAIPGKWEEFKEKYFQSPEVLSLLKKHFIQFIRKGYL